MPEDIPPPTFFQKCLQKIKPSTQKIHNKEAINDLLRQAQQQNIINIDTLNMMEGALQISDMQVRDIMIPRPSMEVIDKNLSLDKILDIVIKTAHSRFPVIGEHRGDVIGILLAKDLLHSCGQKKYTFKMRDLLRQAVFVPESKRLHILLKEFRDSRNHMAIVVDEYGAAAGMVTIEDVIEQIVGNIEDEHDVDEEDNIFKLNELEYTVKAKVHINEFNQHFNTQLHSSCMDTIGGLLAEHLGRLPKRGDKIQINDLCFMILRSDSRKAHLLRVRKKPQMNDKKETK